eukprot:15457109-Alexandrium_andersonii.AAC.1
MQSAESPFGRARQYIPPFIIVQHAALACSERPGGGGATATQTSRRHAGRYDAAGGERERERERWRRADR